MALGDGLIFSRMELVMMAKKIVDSVGGGAAGRVALVDGRKEISIADLLIWAIRDQQVMHWIDAEHDRLGGMKSQLGALVQHCLLGGRVDGGGAVCGRMPLDAMMVGFAVQGLGENDRRVVVDCAMNADEPYQPHQAWKHVTPDGVEMPKIYDRSGRRKASSCYGRDENGKRIRLNVCHIVPVFSDAEIRYFKPQYKNWIAALEKLTEQLVDLTGYILDVNSLTKKHR